MESYLKGGDKMNFSKKGLSDVVTTVLIILLAIAAVTLIWSFIKPNLESAGDKLNADCLTSEVIVTSCKTDDTEVTYQLKSGDVPDSVKLIYYTGDTSQVNTADELPLSVLGSVAASPVSSETAPTTGYDSVAVAAIYNGNACEESPKKECTEPAP